MSLTLAPETEELIRSVAVLRGQDPEIALNMLLQHALAEAEAEAETIRASLQASEDEFNRGGGKTREEWEADIMARRSQRAVSLERGPSDEAPRHVIRRSRQVSEQVDQEWERLKDLTDERTADSWQDGLLGAIAGFADYPERCAVAVEDRLFPNAVLRQLVYQRRRGGPVWRVLFSVHPADEDDPPTVRVHLIRHGAQASMAEWPSVDEA